MEKFRGQTNAFSVGPPSSAVLNIPKEIVEEFEIKTDEKKTFFDIYTNYDGDKKRIIYEFTKHAEKDEINKGGNKIGKNTK